MITKVLVEISLKPDWNQGSTDHKPCWSSRILCYSPRKGVLEFLIALLYKLQSVFSLFQLDSIISVPPEWYVYLHRATDVNNNPSWATQVCRAVLLMRENIKWRYVLCLCVNICNQQIKSSTFKLTVVNKHCNINTWTIWMFNLYLQVSFHCWPLIVFSLTVKTTFHGRIY